MTLEMGPAGDLVRVRRIDEDHRLVFVELRNGQTATLNSDDPVDWDAGTVLLVTRDGGRTSVDKVPADVWPEEPWVGVVRLQLSDRLVVETNGQLRLIPTNGVECKVGNTVEGRDSTGVVRVLSEDSVRPLDLPDIDDTAADRFISSGSSVTFDDFGGLDDVKARARELIETPLQHHEALTAIALALSRESSSLGSPAQVRPCSPGSSRRPLMRRSTKSAGRRSSASGTARARNLRAIFGEPPNSPGR